ncbi:hypothetical protein C2U70_16255 [Bradyrhizobium guangdongense]|uniref:hypothetical protein n=1 Tax=Bradyrhizobium guangdongense TaxID=1325090 RepID=UPI0011270089|nr:hypothetical protein [Bradyrhizobium guangdongense]TPQ34895.1 hypothetical protein C2U70_16255 [Bradyrhizobium guangdongense]
MYPFVTIEKLACVRRRLAIEADLLMTAALPGSGSGRPRKAQWRFRRKRMIARLDLVGEPSKRYF